jgi:hypothetical protein
LQTSHAVDYNKPWNTCRLFSETKFIKKQRKPFPEIRKAMKHKQWKLSIENAVRESIRRRLKNYHLIPGDITDINYPKEIFC